MIGNRELVALGLNHRTAPVSLRERLAVEPARLAEHLGALRDVADETVILSTCNRVEVYAVVPGDDLGAGIAEVLGRSHGIKSRELEPHLYRHVGEDAVKHLFRVASSLDSLVVGEPQILGQVKDAFQAAIQLRSAGRVLQPLMRRTLSVAKRVRTETRIGQTAVSVGGAGVELARQIFGDLKGRRALLLGAGEMGRLVAQALLAHGVEELVVMSRSYDTAAELAGRFGGTAAHLDQLERYLGQVDIVVAATGARHHLLTRSALAPVFRVRRWRPLLLVDLAVPRNVDPDVHELEGAFLFNVDDLEAVARRNQEVRQTEAHAATTLVQEEAHRCYRSLGGRAADPVIAAIGAHAERARLAELERSHALLEGLDERQRATVDAMTRAMFKRFLHNSYAFARRRGEQGDEEALGMLAEAITGEENDA